MSLVYTYDGSVVAYQVAPSGLQITNRADMGEAGSATIPVEDPSANKTIVGHKPFIIEDDECAQPVLFRGWTTQRDIGRSLDLGMFVGANARLQDVTLVDLNACLDFRTITRTGAGGGNRPAETWAERLTWILESEYLSDWIPADQTFVVVNTTAMDATDYRGSTPRAVMQDLSERSGGAYTFFVFWDPISAAVRLFFDNDSAYISDCTLAISNVVADIDGTTTFAPDSVTVLQREPDQVYSDVCVEYFDGTKKLFRSRPSTYATYVRRSATIQRPYTKGLATATAQAEKWLDKHAVETDRITCTIRVPAASVGLIQAGQSIAARFSHLGAPYSAAGGATMRIVSCSPKPTDDTGYFYDVALELVYRPLGGVDEGCVVASGYSDLEVTGSKIKAVDGDPTISITPTAGEPCVIVAACVVGYWSGANADAWTSGAGYTTLDSDNSWPTGGTAHPLQAILYKSVASPAGAYTPNGTYTDTGGAEYTRWAMLALAIASTDAAPVQSAFNVYERTDPSPYSALPGSPTANNSILMVAWFRDFISYGAGGDVPAPYPDDGRWTLLGGTGAWSGGDVSQDAVYAWARCVTDGDGDTYGVAAGGGTGAVTVSLSEWTVTTDADTVVDLGPTPGATTTHTVDPTVDDDVTLGYGTAGMLWVNTTTGDTFVLVDGADGAAVWEGITGAATDHGALTGLTDDDHTQYVLKRYGGKEVVSTVAAAGATETLDLADGNVHDVTLDQDVTLTFAGATAGVACSFTLLLRQDGTGGWTTTWPGSVVWAGGSAPTLDETASTVAVLTFFTLDGGTVWYGFPTGGGGVAGGTPALTFGTTNAQGAAATAVLTDATLAIFDATVPTTAAASDAAATGSAAFGARRDHRHGMPAFAGELLVADSPLPVPRGTFSTTANQTVASTTTAYAVAFATDDLKVGLTHSTVTNNSRIYIDQAGTYSIIVSAIADDTAADKTHLALWLAVDGTNVANSNTVVEIATKETEVVVAVAFAYDFTAGQYFELMYRGDATTTRFIQTAAGASPTRPASPAVIVAVNMEAPAAGLLTNGPTPLLTDAADDYLYADT